MNFLMNLKFVIRKILFNLMIQLAMMEDQKISQLLFIKITNKVYKWKIIQK